MEGDAEVLGWLWVSIHSPHSYSIQHLTILNVFVLTPPTGDREVLPSPLDGWGTQAQG